MTGLDTAKAEILAALANTPLPAATDYVAEDAALQELPAAVEVSEHLFGGMPCQLGWCNGHNTYLNCLEYHRDSEFNLGTEAFILLLAKQDEMENGVLDTAKVRAFPRAGGRADRGLRHHAALLPLPRGPREGLPRDGGAARGHQHRLPPPRRAQPAGPPALGAQQVVIAHPDSAPAAKGAVIGLTGENIDIAGDL